MHEHAYPYTSIAFSVNVEKMRSLTIGLWL